MQTLLLRFRSQEIFLWKICGETFYSNVQKFVWKRHVGARLDGHQHGDWKQKTETAVTEQLLQKLDVIAQGTQKH